MGGIDLASGSWYNGAEKGGGLSSGRVQLFFFSCGGTDYDGYAEAGGW